VLVIATGILGLAVAGLAHVVHGGDAGRDEAEPDRQVSGQRAPDPTERTPVPRPALPQAVPPVLPQAQPVEPAPAEPLSRGRLVPGATAANRKFTQSKVQKYVHEAYPAWLRAHPGEECPHQLIELNEYMDDKNANDAWGRPLKMLCGAHRWAGAKRIEVISRGRDAEAGTEDDIRAEE
jgi:hypothetical protein